MKKYSKRILKIKNNINLSNINSIDDIILNIKDNSNINFIENIDLSIKLNVDIKMPIKGYIILPNNTGKILKIGVFANNNELELIKNSNADYIGMNDILNKYINKEIHVDLFISTKKSINLIEKDLLLKLNNKDIIPNYKLGTITDDLVSSVENYKYKTIFYKIDKNGILNTFINKLNCDSSLIKENILFFLENIKILNRNILKKNNAFYKSIFLSSTMGISMKIDKKMLTF